MFKRVSVFVYVVVLAVALWGLALPVGAQDGDEFRATFELEGPAADGPLAGVDPTGVEFEWWHQHGGSRAEQVDEIVAEFNNSNPWDITVNASYQGRYDDMHDAVITGLSTGDLPALVVGYQNHARRLHQAGGVLDLRPLMDDPTWGFNAAEQADFVSGALAQDTNPDDGAQLGFPVGRSAEFLYYNPALLQGLGYDGPPATWDEFREMACAFSASGGGVGYAFQPSATVVTAATLAQGGTLYDAQAGTVNLNTPATITALTTLQALVSDGCAQVTEPRPYSDRDEFTAGRTLFWIGGSTSLSSMQGADFDVAYVPYAGSPVVEIFGPSLSIVQGNGVAPEQQLAAWLFVRWLSEPVQQARWFELSGAFPVRITRAPALDQLWAGTPQYEAAWDLLLNADQGYVPAEMGRAAYGALYEAVTDIIMDGADVEATLEALDIPSAP